MIINKKETYKCEYCLKLYQVKGACERHEVSCHHNPDNNRACYGCVFLEKKNTELYIDHYDGSQGERDVTLFHCSKKDMFLYPPKNEHKGNFFDLGNELNEPMPRECELRSTDSEPVDVSGYEHIGKKFKDFMKDLDIEGY